MASSNKSEKDSSKCDCKKFVLLRSYSLKICTECLKAHSWELDKGQKPLITSSKDRGL